MITVNNLGQIPQFKENPYLKYLSTSDKKRMLCGYMLEDMLEEYSDLDKDCTASYRTYSNGRIRQICRCK